MIVKDNLPDGWIRTAVQDIAETSTGGTPSRKQSHYFGGEIPWVKSGELGDSAVYETEETLSKKGLGSSAAKIFPKGTLCIVLYGATVGKLGILGVDAATNQAITVAALQVTPSHLGSHQHRSGSGVPGVRSASLACRRAWKAQPAGRLVPQSVRPGFVTIVRKCSAARRMDACCRSYAARRAQFHLVF